MKHNANVPAFLTKLWTLVEDLDTNEFICWSQEGTSFLVLDEQRFAKEILPKFFKHNNMASFVRQLNMYGFRKVMHIDVGLVKQEKEGPVEFQHPYFKHGQDDLLENIKRKVSNTRPEENKNRQDDLSKILTDVQNVHEQQENMDARLATLKRENEALWTELSDLRQKHAQQQLVIKELVQFIFTLAQNNHMLNTKRKRPLALNINGKKPKFLHQISEEPVEHSKSTVNGLNSEISDDVIICDVTEEDSEVTAGVSSDHGDDAVGVSLGSSQNSKNVFNFSEADPFAPEESVPRAASDGSASSRLLQLDKPSGLSLEDPLKLMDSILSENGVISQNINLLGKVELMDYLDSIDCSLEDFQALLYGKPFSFDPDILAKTVTGQEDQLDKDQPEPNDTDKQLVQYTTCPLLAFLDGCNPLSSADAPTQKQDQPEAADLLESVLETPSSSLIRLEPLTEEEASQATLFYLCDLPAAPLDL